QPPRAMSELSAYIMARTDFAGIASSRRHNYARLMRRIERLSGVRPILGRQRFTPLGLPVAVGGRARDRLRRHLGKNGIFCPVHWDLGSYRSRVGAAARTLSDSILTLPIDQRCDDGAIDYLAGRVEEFFQ